MRLYRTSVKEDLNVTGVFQHLAENYVNKVKSYAEPNEAEFQIGASSRSYSTSYVTNNSRGPLYTTKQQQPSVSKNNNNNNGYHHKTTNGGYIPSIYSNPPHRPRVMSTVDRRYYTGPNNYVSSFSPQDYLNNPMFDSLNHHRRYWPQDRTITLRPLTSKAKNGSALHRKMMAPRNACKVLS
jgi:hypothetical protein